MREPGTIEPGTLTLDEAMRGIAPRPFTRAEWDAMNLAVYRARETAILRCAVDRESITHRMHLTTIRPEPTP